MTNKLYGAKFRVMTARRANMLHSAQFHADRSNQCGCMAVFRFLKMAAVRHLLFLNV